MPPLADDASLWNRCQWRTRQLFRAGGLAVGWPQIVLSFVAVCVFFAGSAALGWLADTSDAGAAAPRLVEVVSIENSDTESNPVAIVPLWQTELESNSLATLVSPWASVVAPLVKMVWGEPQILLGSSGPKSPSMIWRLLFVAWALACWSLFGVAICRSVAVLAAKDRSETLRDAMQFAWPRWPLTMSAPSIPAGAILAIGAGLIVAAWFGRLPWIGTPLLAVASPLLLIAGIAIAFLAFVIIFGWPLMIAAMGVEDCDGFGALSRAYSFLSGRPLLAVFNVAISAIVGGVLVALVGGWFTLALLAEANFLQVSIGNPARWATVMQWSHFFAVGILLSFAASLFWTLATLNYLLLREAVDGKPLDDIAPGVSELSVQRDLPVVGIPATDYKPAETDGQATAHEEAQG